MAAPRRVEVLVNEPDWLREPEPAAAGDAEQAVDRAAVALQRWSAEVDAAAFASAGPSAPPRAAWARTLVLAAGAAALASPLGAWALVEHRLDAERAAAAVPAATGLEANAEGARPGIPPEQPAPALLYPGAAAAAPPALAALPVGQGRKAPAAQAPRGAGTAQTARGAALALRGEFKRAAAAFWRATRAEPANADAWSGLALCQFELGNERAAAAAGARALRLAPDHPEAAVLMGFIAQGKGAYQTSRRLYERYLAANPGGDWAEELKSVLEHLPTEGALAAHRPAAAQRASR